MAAHRLRELPGLLVTHVRGCADQPAHGVPLLELAHVEPHHPLVAAEQRVREGPRQLRLADTGGPEEEEAADGPPRVREAGAGPQHRLGHGRHRLVLPDDAFLQVLLQAEQPVLLLLREAADGNAGLTADDLGDVLGRDLQDAVAGVPVRRLAAAVPDPGLHLLDAVAQLGGPFVLLGRHRLVLVAGELLHLPLQGPHVGRLGVGAQPHPGPGLVDEVDRLVGQEPLREVPVGELHGRQQGLLRVPHLVVGLVPVAQPAQDLRASSVLGSGTRIGWKRQGERRVLLDA